MRRISLLHHHETMVVTTSLLLIVLLVTLQVSSVHGFGVVVVTTANTATKPTTSTTSCFHMSSSFEEEGTMQDVVDALAGVTYADALEENLELVLEETEDDLLSKRVPVAIRYSGESGMKPYFLTVAQRIKEAHPDALLHKVILPKVVSSEGGGPKAWENPIFEVMVDGKVIVPSMGRKDNHIGVFVSMQDLDLAMSRARRRRRPSTVYGGKEENVSLDLIKAKLATSKGPNHKHKPSKD